MDAATLSVLVRVNGASAAAAELGRVDAAGRKAGSGLDTIHTSSRRASGSMSGMSSTVKQLGAAVGLTGLAGGLIAAGKTVVGFDQAMRNVNSIAGLAPKQFKALSASVNDLAGKTAQAPQTLAEGMYQLVSSGFDAQDSLKILKSSAVAATAGLTDTATATTAVAGVLNAYHLKAKDAAQVSDDLFQTVNLGVLSFQDLAQGIGPVLPFASKLGINLKELGAATSTLTKAGIPAAEAFTYQKGAMTALIKPTDQLQAVYKKLGVASGSDLIKKTGSFQAALQDLWVASGRNKEAFSKLFPDVRALGAAFGLTGSNARGAKKDLAGFANDAGATRKVFGEQSKSMAVQWQKFVAELQTETIKIGSKIAPDVIKGLHDINKAMDELGHGKGPIADVVGGFKDVNDWLNKLNLGTGGLFRMWSQFSKGYKDLQQQLGVIDVKVNLDKGSLKHQLGNLVGLAQASGVRYLTIQAVLKGDGPVREKMAALRALVDGVSEAKVLAILKGDGAVKLKIAALDALASGISLAKVQAVMSGDGSVKRKIAELKRLTANIQPVHISVSASTSAALHALGQVMGAIQGIPPDPHSHVSIIGAGAAVSAANAVAGALGAIHDVSSTITTNYVQHGVPHAPSNGPHAAGRGPIGAERALVGEEGGHPEWIGNSPDNMKLVHGPRVMSLRPDDYVIPTNPARRGTAEALWASMGVATYAKGKKGHSKRLVPSHVYAKHSTDYYDGVVQSLISAAGEKDSHNHSTARARRARKRLGDAKRQRNAAHKYADQIEAATKEADIAADDMAKYDKLDDQGHYNTAYSRRRKQLQIAIRLLNGAVKLNPKAGKWNREMRGQLASLGSSLADMPANPASILPAAGDVSTYSTAEEGILTGMDKDISLAALTVATGDDSAALGKKASYLSGLLSSAKANNGAGRGGAAGIKQIADDLKSTQDAISGLSTQTSASQDQQALLDQANAKAAAAQRSSDINAAALATFTGAGDIGTGGSNAYAAAGGVTVNFHSTLAPSPAEAQRAAGIVVNGIGYQQPASSPRLKVG